MVFRPQKVGFGPKPAPPANEAPRLWQHPPASWKTHRAQKEARPPGDPGSGPWVGTGRSVHRERLFKHRVDRFTPVPPVGHPGQIKVAVVGAVENELLPGRGVQALDGRVVVDQDVAVDEGFVVREDGPDASSSAHHP